MTQTMYVRNPQEMERLMESIRAALLHNREISTKNVGDTQVELTILPKKTATIADLIERAQSAVGDLAEAYDGLVPAITFHADGTVVVVEQDVHAIGHLSDPNHLPMKVHTLRNGEQS